MYINYNNFMYKIYVYTYMCVQNICISYSIACYLCTKYIL